jgi:hypothetical protein
VAPFPFILPLTAGPHPSAHPPTSGSPPLFYEKSCASGCVSHRAPTPFLQDLNQCVVKLSFTPRPSILTVSPLFKPSYLQSRPTPAMALMANARPSPSLSPSSLYKSEARAPASTLSSLAFARLLLSPRAAPPPPEPQGVLPVCSLICRLGASPERADATLSFALPSHVRSSPSRYRRTTAAPQPLGA